MPRNAITRRLLFIAALTFELVRSQGADAQAATSSNETPQGRPENGYWSVGTPRWFVSTRSEAGPTYLKPYFSAGYGMPHWIWAGIDLNAISTFDLGQFAAGVRAATPIVDFAFAFRDTWSYGKPFLEPAGSYTRHTVLDAPGARAHYLALESELTAIAPLPHSALVANLIMIDALNMPNGKYIYEEDYRAVVKNPLFFVLRVTPVVRVLNEDALKIGVLTEFAFNTGRGQGVWRVGPVGALQLTDHLQLMAGVTLAVSSPDHLGLTLGSYGLAGFRYQWATGERNPKLPWQGFFIP